jgi:hypothetical protein
MNDAAQMEHKAAKSMSQLSWTKSTLFYAIDAVSANASEFFSNLIDSRVRAWTLLLLRHSLSTGDNESRERLLGMLSASIRVIKAETNFRCLSLPASAAGQPKEADVILPLLFEVYLYVTVQEKPERIKLMSPGTISGEFAAIRFHNSWTRRGDPNLIHFFPSANFATDPTQDGGLLKVTVRLDTGCMLNSLVDQARLLVFKAVASVTKTQLPPSPSYSKDDQDLPSVASAKLDGFRSALTLSPDTGGTGGNTDEAVPRLQKARNSALRLNSILLHGKADKTATTLGARRHRSVNWENPSQLPILGVADAPSAKKQRMAQNAAKLTSIKSFGRPHGGDAGSGPRNATFGEFGGRAQMWGRDGRMVHHPTPMQAGLTADQDEIGLTGLASKNATFDMLRPGHKQTSIGKAPSSSALHRTPTQLESWLIKRSTENH